jgi:hypothetical protein
MHDMGLVAWLVTCMLVAQLAHADTRHAPHQPHRPHVRSTPIRPDNVRVDPTTDCAIKQLAWSYAQSLQGSFQPAVSSLVHDALELGTACGVDEPVSAADQQFAEYFPTQLKWKRNAKTKESTLKDAMTLFVDSTAGQRHAGRASSTTVAIGL